MLRYVVASLLVVVACCAAAWVVTAEAGTVEAGETPLGVIRDLIENARYGEAEHRTRQRLRELEAAAADDIEIAAVMNLLVEALCNGGKASAPESAAIAQRALEIRRRVLGGKHPDVAESLHTMACLSWSQGDYDTAGDLLEQALVIRQAAFDEPTAAVAGNLNDLGLLRKSQGDYRSARSLYDRALAIHETAGSSIFEMSSSLTNYAVLLRDIGDLEGARRLLERSGAMAEGAYSPDHPRLATHLNSLARLLHALGDYAGARPLFERVLKIREAAFGPHHPDVGISCNNLALLLQAMGDYREAGEYFKRARSIWERALPPEHPHVVTGLNNQAGLLHTQGDLEAARVLYQRVLEMRRRIQGDDHPLVARTLHNLAGLLTESGELAAARGHYQRALTILESTFGPSHPRVADTVEKLAVLLQTEGDVGGAVELFERSLEIRRDTLGVDHPDVAAVLSHLAAGRYRLGDLNAAVEAALASESIGRDHARLTIRSLPERQALSFATIRPVGLHTVLSVAVAANDQATSRRAWDALIRTRGMVLDEMTARRRVIEAAGDPGLESLLRQLFEARQRLANLYVRSSDRVPPATRRQLTDDARREKDRSEALLVQRSAEFRRRQSIAEVGVQDVEEALPDGSAMVAYALVERPPSSTTGRPQGDSAYLAFVQSSRSEAPQVVDLGAARDLDARIQAWRDQVSRYSERRYRQAGEALRRAIWDPVAEHLAGAQQVFLVPAGDLHLVSFAALPVGEAGYLVEHGPLLVQLSAERDLVARKTLGHGKGLLALGGADFAATPQGVPGAASADHRAIGGCPTLRQGAFEALDATIDEVDEIVGLWRQRAPPDQGAGLRLIGPAATETAFKQQAPGRRVVHLATHGFVLAEPGLLPPLLRSGLALTGANHCLDAPPQHDDGVLTAEEIAGMNLSAPELVVLSACETGVGVQVGEGVFGLRRAFRTAGAESLVMSLWRVDDRSTHLWMRSFYSLWLGKDLTVAEAVRHANLDRLTDLRLQKKSTHPSSWGGFVAEGGWR